MFVLGRVIKRRCLVGLTLHSDYLVLTLDGELVWTCCDILAVVVHIQVLWIPAYPFSSEYVECVQVVNTIKCLIFPFSICSCNYSALHML